MNVGVDAILIWILVSYQETIKQKKKKKERDSEKHGQKHPIVMIKLAIWHYRTCELFGSHKC